MTLICGKMPEYMDCRPRIIADLRPDATWREYQQMYKPFISSYYDIESGKWETVTDVVSSRYEMHGDICCLVPIYAAGPSLPDYAYDTLYRWDTSPVYTYDAQKKLSSFAKSQETYMMPDLLHYDTKTADTGTSVSFDAMPEFDGNEFRIFWDAGNDERIVSCYVRGCALSSLRHDYGSYGTHTICFSANVKKFKVPAKANWITGVRSRNGNPPLIDGMQYCRRLLSADVSVSAIEDQKYDCYELTSLKFEDAKRMTKSYAINCMYNLRVLEMPKLVLLSGQSVLKGNANMENASFPELTAIAGAYNFQTCVSLTAASFPKLISCGVGNFDGCVNLRQTNFNALSAIPDTMFNNCVSLSSIRLPSVNKIGISAFMKCRSLAEIDLSEHETKIDLADANAFYGCPDGYVVKVSAALRDRYLTDLTWREISSHIRYV